MKRTLATLVVLALLVVNLVPPPPGVTHAASSSSPVRRLAGPWYVAGDFQGWDPGATSLYDDGTNGDLIAGDKVYSRDYMVAAAGRHEWKVTDGTWGVTFPADNSWFYTTAPNQTVKFTFDTNTIPDGYSPATNIVNVNDAAGGITTWTAVGDWQGWDPGSAATAMTAIAPGIYAVTYTVAAAGSYQYKVTKSGSWTDDQFGPGGRQKNAPTLGFNTTAPNQAVAFYLDLARGRIRAVPAGTPGAGQWYLRGSMNGWGTTDLMYDDGTHGDLLAGDGIYSLDYTFGAAGTHEWKIAVSDWSLNYPASNAWLTVSAPGQTIKFTLDTNTYNDGWLPKSNIVQATDDMGAAWTAVGDWQGWNNAHPATAMTSLGPGQFAVTYTVGAAGAHMYKAVKTGSWHAVGADGRGVNANNVDFDTYTANQTVAFYLDAARGRVKTFAFKPATHGHDGVIDKDGLFHDSRDTTYRTPVGAVPTGQAVTIRLRAFANDLTGVKVRVYDDRADTATLYPMTVEASDATYDYWAYTFPPQTQPTVFWYRFIAEDMPAVAYYEDDVRDAGGVYRGYNEGGPGKAYTTSPDYSYQLTVYDPAFQTPAWMQNGIVYQIFPDRFRNGNGANNVISGTHFVYGNAAGGLTYPAWNSPVINPRDPASPYVNRWNEDFYGGDLQGIKDKLGYLKSLGVTALYLNPIFRSPSTHKYDTTSFEEVDPALGGNDALAALLAAAQAQGMKVILDGVFNHTSSDSIYFDKYSRYPTSGAYESPTSPYYDWYTFSNWPTAYNSWWGYDSLPILRSNNPAVRTYIYSGTNAIATRWVISGTAGWRLDVGGDIDPGLTRDPANVYWEEFRAQVKAANPDAIIIGEEWGDATPWLLGHEWDAVMNYRFRSAALSFLRDRHYEDNDNNAGSSGGVLDPIQPSQLDAWLHSIQEDYPPAAWQAMMNLLGSHDTNRVRFVLSKNQKADDATHASYNPATDYDPATVDMYQKLLALLQFTTPGAPTVYYGDEVGIEAPGYWANNKWEDDPYNRVPFPWSDTPGYYRQRAGLSTYYSLLGQARAARPALRTGDFHTLLIDDANLVYAYGRKQDADAALVIINRDAAAHDVTVNVSGYLGNGALFGDVLRGGVTYLVADGQITVPNVPAMGGALLVLASGDVTPPAAPTNLTAIEGQGQVTLSWDAGADKGDAVGYHVYRSILTGGGFTRIVTDTASTNYVDTAVTNGHWYYYKVTAVDAAGNESSPTGQVAAMPHLTIGWANLQWPYEIHHTIGVTPTENIYGQVWIDGATSLPGPTPGLIAQVGYGPTATAPSAWTAWVDATFNTQAGNNDEFKGQLTPEQTGEFYYVYRYSTTGGRDWTYADRSGIIDPTAKGVVNPGKLHVHPAGDTTAPPPPTNLRVTHWGVDHITLAWDAVAATDLYAYDLYRWGEGQTAADKVMVARVLAPTAVYTDETVLTNHTYTYTVQSVDTSFNRAGFSNEAAGRAVQRLVAVTFNVTTPAFTPATDTVYIAGDNATVLGASWNPGHRALTKVDATHWTITLPAPEDTPLQYKYARGTWDKVEKWGPITGLANRSLTIVYGATGAMTVDDVIYNWRDPLVTAVYPPAGATGFSVTGPISATFNRGLNPATVNAATVLVNDGAVLGTVGYVSPTIIFTPTVPLDPHQQYQVRLTTGIKDGEDGIPMQAEYAWTFGAAGAPALSIAKTVALTHDPARPGDPITYTVVVRNTGSADAIGVHITDTLPGSIVGTNVDETHDIAAGQAVTLTIPATVSTDAPEGVAIVNTAYYQHSAGAGFASATFTTASFYRLYLPLVVKNY